MIKHSPVTVVTAMTGWRILIRRERKEHISELGGHTEMIRRQANTEFRVTRK